MANVRHCDFLVNEFENLSANYVHFETDAFRKRLKLRIP